MALLPKPIGSIEIVSRLLEGCEEIKEGVKPVSILLRFEVSSTN
jgi:hypothetical protein